MKLSKKFSSFVVLKDFFAQYISDVFLHLQRLFLSLPIFCSFMLDIFCFLWFYSNPFRPLNMSKPNFLDHSKMEMQFGSSSSTILGSKAYFLFESSAEKGVAKWCLLSSYRCTMKKSAN